MKNIFTLDILNVNQDVQHTREEEKFNVELLQDSIRNLYSRRLQHAINEEFEGSSVTNV
jgi:hypothetical protein